MTGEVYTIFLIIRTSDLCDHHPYLLYGHHRYLLQLLRHYRHPLNQIQNLRRPADQKHLELLEPSY
jgi:hypothetical protein